MLEADWLPYTVAPDSGCSSLSKFSSMCISEFQVLWIHLPAFWGTPISKNDVEDKPLPDLSHGELIHRKILVKSTSAFLPLLFLYIDLWNLQKQQFRHWNKGLAQQNTFYWLNMAFCLYRYTHQTKQGTNEEQRATKGFYSKEGQSL